MRLGKNYPTGEAWHEAHRYDDNCGRCGERVVKRRAVCLLAREGAYGTPRKVCYLYEACWAGFLEELIL